MLSRQGRGKVVIALIGMRGESDQLRVGAVSFRTIQCHSHRLRAGLGRASTPAIQLDDAIRIVERAEHVMKKGSKMSQVTKWP